MAKVLLVAEALIRGDQQLVAVSLRTIEQCSIAQIRPASLEGRVHECSVKWSRNGAGVP